MAEEEIAVLHDKHELQSREIVALKEKLECYVSMTSLVLANHPDVQLSNSEMENVMLRVRRKSYHE